MRAGVIGTGSMGANHARVYAEMGLLAGVCDTRREAAEEVGRRLGVKWYTDVQRFLEEVRPDVVSIATPTTTHHTVAMEALKRGIHTLVEKPITMFTWEAEELMELAKDRGVVLAAGHIERFNPVVEAAADLLKKDWVGEPLSFSSQRLSMFPSRVKDVGVIMDLGIHDIDVIYYLSGRRVEKVFALGGSGGNTRFEDHATILLDFEGDLYATLHVSWLVPMKVRRLSVTTTRSYTEIDYMDQFIEVSTSEFVNVDMGNLYNVPQRYDIRRIHVRREEPLKREIRDFLRAAETGGRPLVTAEDALEVLRVAKAAEASLLTGDVIEVSEFEEASGDVSRVGKKQDR
ncbi:MAG: Gfo/Idh/MocA family oxidoreductase [Thermoplasmata archaeon]|nr:Gfo/Idh/MocA family oxidoreductase [Thermoplasmata archaeon]